MARTLAVDRTKTAKRTKRRRCWESDEEYKETTPKATNTTRHSPRLQTSDSPSDIVPRATRQRVKDAARIATLQVSEPARTAVFNTTELLENIFEFVPGRDLIRSTMVSRLFKDTIENSSKLQKKLFLAADTQTDATSSRYNHIIFDSGRDYPEPEDESNVMTYRSFLPASRRWFTPSIPQEVRFRLIVPQRVLIGESFEAGELAWMRDTSCLKMFLTQPPVHKVFLSAAFGAALRPASRRDETFFALEYVRRYEEENSLGFDADEFYKAGDGRFLRGRDPFLIERERRSVNLRFPDTDGVTLGHIRAFLSVWLKVLNKRHSTHRIHIVPTKTWIDIYHDDATHPPATDKASYILKQIDWDKD